jgi:acetyl esterase/lipase
MTFRTTSLNDSIEDLHKLYEYLYEKYKGNVGIIGSSSGSYLAIYLVNILNSLKKSPKLILLLCPVLDPEAREKFLGPNIEKN